MPTAHPSVSPAPRQPAETATPEPASTAPTAPTAKPTGEATGKPSTKPATEPKPSATPPPTDAPTTTWYTSSTATDAARRMSAAGTVGDAACTLSAVGRPDPALVPHESRIGIGHHGTYWCLVW
ncbi:hypothetical protein [Streptomyces sp. NPDC014764]|uniref:hypothetical protein n=1 Tax=Streptomyces sp. NPDC014764 TaxID=3364907 RepID=UPI003700B860